MGRAVQRWFLRDELRDARTADPTEAPRRELVLARQLLDAAELLFGYEKLAGAALVLLGDAAVLLKPADPELAELSAGLSPSDIAALGSEQRRTRLLALRDAVTASVARLEAEAYRHERLLSLRRWRISLVSIGALSGLLAVLLALGVIGPAPNLALGKRATPSSNLEGEDYPPRQLVDGNADDLGFHTELEDEPSVTIDLLASQTIRRVVVVNRSSYRERALPLVIETSTDGKIYRHFARRQRLFNTWTAKSAPVQARFVRLRVENTTYFHLNEVSIY